MRIIFSLILLMTSCVSLAIGQRTNTSTAAGTQADVRAAILKLEDANNTARVRGDGNVLSSLYADDFAGVNAAGGKTDKENIVSFYSDDGPVLAIHTTDDIFVRVMTNAALVTARLKYQYNDKMEDRSVLWLKYTRVYEKRGNEWKIVAEHFSFAQDPTKK